MKVNGTRTRMVPLAREEGIPVELRIGEERIDVWIDQRGIHFRQEDARVVEGHLSWDVALAMSLLPAGWGSGRPAA